MDLAKLARRRYGRLLPLLALGAWCGIAALNGCTPHSPGPAARPTTVDRARAARDTGQPYVAHPLPRPTRAVWVARMHYRYPEDVTTIMRNCAALGVDTVLWQVRGEGTVAYPSAIEPWAAEFGHQDPGWDPLALAVTEAHRHGLRIEAWVNVMPGWKGRQPPPDPRQLHHSHPDWFLHDARGQRQPLGDFYVILNPCLPEVRAHITSVCEEIVTRYAVDGLHLDYVRYAWDTTPQAAQRYPRDRRTLELYRRETGQAPDDDKAAWDRWRAAAITRLVRDIRTMLVARRPDATLTAAVWQDPGRGLRDHLQDGATWLRDGLLDAAMPMAYTNDASVLTRNIAAYQAAAPGGRIVPGIGLYKLDTADGLRAQLAQCAAWGGDMALFSYDSLHATAGDRRRVPLPPEVTAARTLRRSVLGEFVPAR